MINGKVPNLFIALPILAEAKDHILQEWLAFDEARKILDQHTIEVDFFCNHFASGVFDYFMEVIRGQKEIGDCPVIGDLLVYLKDRDVSADELFILCSHFRRSMLDFSYDSSLNNRMIFDEISYVFDLNFSGVLRRYTGTIYQKDLEIERNVKLLNEYKKAIDASGIVSKMDPEGKITFINDNFCKVSGYIREELIGKEHKMILNADEEQPFERQFLETIEPRSIYNKTLTKRKNDGSFFYVDSTIVPIINTEGLVAEYIVIGYEVTTLIKAEQEAVEAGISKEYFLSNMSHEIRTPLNAILGFVSILQDEVGNPTHKKYLEIVLNSGENLLTIINDILDFSKLRSGEFMIETSRFNLHEELTHTLELFVASANEKEITMLAYLDPHIPYELEADPLRIKQIIANFISNAIKFTPAEGTVELEAFCVDRTLSISIKDTGVGIAKEDQKRIFNAFTQAKNSEGFSGGSGLGLAICKKLAQHMGGDVSVESTVGEGSVFTLKLPVLAHETMTLEMFNVEPFKKLTLAMFCQNEELSKPLQSLQRYLNIFELDVIRVDELKEDSYDLLFFSDSEVNETLRSKIENQMLPSIAIMDYFDNRYEAIANITPLYFPIYCSKLYHTFLDALHLSQENDASLLKNEPKKRHFKGNVLVAEDNSANQELIKIILERYGLHYLIASDGQEAIMRFKSGTFDLVLMDEQMPKKNGTQATNEIRKFEKKRGRAPTPIVALTANILKGEKENSQGKGFDEFLGKPIVLKEMEEVLSHYLEEKVTDTAETKQVGVENITTIKGVDVTKLAEKLMLDEEQIIHLIKVYCNKMEESLKELAMAIAKRDYKEIGHLSHSIKGSSSNFRIENIVILAYELEKASYAEESTFDFETVYDDIVIEYKSIAIEE
ncbi:MAG: ATP-binding protein [Helicobacteraceae bacterium]|jgi:PAS domain S-box-containing protein|nr:ATP-binding protein [Helicobacteraceae bacterium]